MGIFSCQTLLSNTLIKHSKLPLPFPNFPSTEMGCFHSATPDATDETPPTNWTCPPGYNNNPQYSQTYCPSGACSDDLCCKRTGKTENANETETKKRRMGQLIFSDFSFEEMCAVNQSNANLTTTNTLHIKCFSEGGQFPVVRFKASVRPSVFCFLWTDHIVDCRTWGVCHFLRPHSPICFSLLLFFSA